MSVLVTGATGFVGRALVGALQRAGHDVTAAGRVDGDVAELRAPEATTHVVHLAARTFIPDSWKHPAEFYRVNVQGTVNVLELCRARRCGLTFVSSYVYGPPQRLPVHEDHPLHPNNPYTHSKKLAEDLCRFYAEHFAVPLTILRPFNIYGPGQRATFLIPTILGQVLSPEVQTVEVMDLEPRRDWLSLDDLVDAIAKTIGHGGGTFNVGSGSSVSVAEIIRTVFAVTGISKPVRAIGQRRPDEILDLYADISRIRKELDWSPRVSLEEGIARMTRQASG